MSDVECGAHGHDHSKHSHGQSSDGQRKPKKRSFLQNEAFGSFVVFFTVLMPTCCMILQYFWFNESLREYEFAYFLQNLTQFWMYGMSMWSYYQAITIKNDPISRPPPPPDTRDMDPIYKNSEACRQCNKWKPARTHHCSMCNRCTLKMDHHCPWVVNCVGLRNHRAFFLFTMYMGFGAIQYMYRSAMYFSALYYSENFFSHHIVFYVFWTLTSVVLYPTGVMLFFLFCYQGMLMMNNQTTLESMGGGSGNMCCLPQPRGQPLKSINVFDRGCIANVAWFFEYSLFTWWMPFENTYENDGTSYPINPPCSFADLQLAQNSQAVDMNQQIDLDNVAAGFIEFLAQTKERYRGKKIIVNDQIIEIE